MISNCCKTLNLVPVFFLKFEFAVYHILLVYWEFAIGIYLFISVIFLMTITTCDKQHEKN